MIEMNQCYRLARGVELASALIEGEQTGLIYSRNPLYVTRTSLQIISLLQKCDGEHSVTQLARELGKKPVALFPALQSLHQKQLLELITDPEAHNSQLITRNSQLATLVPPDNRQPTTDNLPSVSFLIPVRNRPALLKKCLESIFALDYPSEKFEVIVIDDASEDDTAEVAQTFPVKLVRNERQMGTGPSRNKVAPTSNGDLIAFLDSDCEVKPDWLQKLAPCFEDGRLVLVSGEVRSLEVETIFGRYEDVKSSLYTGPKPAEVKLNGGLDQLPATNLLIRRSAFEIIGGHNAALRFGEDTDLVWRLLKAGGKINYLPITGVKHAYRATLEGFLKTRFGYATGEADLRARHKDKPRILEVAPGIAFGGLNFLAGLTRPNTRWPLLLIGLLPWLWRSGRKWQELEKYQLPISPADVLRAEGRNFLVATSQLGQHLNRYYSLPLLIAALIKPKRFALPAALTLLGPAFGDYQKRQPNLSFPAYAALYLAENAVYQIGLLAGCCRIKNYQALVPKIEIKDKSN